MTTMTAERPLSEVLAETPVFSGLEPEARAKAVSWAQARRFDKGEVVARHGEPWPNVLLVAEGQVRVVKSAASGRVLAAVTLEPGDAFFGNTLMDGLELPATLEAEKPSRLYLWDGPPLLALIRENPRSLWQLVGNLARQMRKAAGVIDSLAFQPLPRRLARLLLERFGPGKAETTRRSMTLDEMAAYIGTTREVVCRLLYRFADEGLISITRTDFSLKDREGLAAMSSEDA